MDFQLWPVCLDQMTVLDIAAVSIYKEEDNKT